MASNTLADSYVYVLFRADGSPFYVGKGRKDRWGDHERDARLGLRSYRLNIIREMLQAGFEEIPKVKVAEGLTHREAVLREIAIIAAIGRYPNGPLVNLTSGGEGNCDQSPEERAKTAERNRTRVWSPESRERAAASLRGKKLSPESIAKRTATCASKPRSEAQRASAKALGASMRGKPKSPEAVAKMAAAKRGKSLPPLTPEHKAAISRANIGRVFSLETRAKMSAAKRGKPFSPEQYAKLRAANLKWHASVNHDVVAS